MMMSCTMSSSWNWIELYSGRRVLCMCPLILCQHSLSLIDRMPVTDAKCTYSIDQAIQEWWWNELFPWQTTRLMFDINWSVVSWAAGEETSDARPAESWAGGVGDAVSVWAAGPPHQGTSARGRTNYDGFFFFNWLLFCWFNCALDYKIIIIE